MKILYGIAGEGFGHPTRAKVIIEHLKKSNEVIVVCGGKAYELLRDKFKAEKIECFRISFKNQKMNNIYTFFQNIVTLPKKLRYNRKLNKIVKNFSPDIIITDFEPFTAYISKKYHIPLISIDDQHIVTNTHIKAKNKFQHIIKKLYKHIFIPFPNYSIITTFVYPRIKNKNTYLIPPILRNEILEQKTKQKTKQKKHILVYLSIKDESYLSNLHNIKEQFIVYGLNKHFKKDNITSKKFDEKSFIEDLSSSKAVITNGGFSTIGECLYFKKPILMIPIKNHYSSLFNAQNIENLGYGMHSNTLDTKSLKIFVNKISEYKNNLKKYKSKDNKELFSVLKNLLNKVSTRKLS